MALEAKRAAYNTAALAAAVAFDDLVDGLAVGDKLYFVYPKEWAATAAGALGATILAKFPTTPGLQNKIIYPIDCAEGTLANGMIKWFLPGVNIGGVPILLLCTNSAGELA